MKKALRFWSGDLRWRIANALFMSFFLFAVLPGAKAAYLKGDAGCEWGERDCNPTIADVVQSVNSLRGRGDVMGFHYYHAAVGMDLGLATHWQGVQRLMSGHPLTKGSFMAVSLSNTSGVVDREYRGPGGFAVVGMGSRNSQGLRYRSNRLQRGKNLQDTPPHGADGIDMYEEIDGRYDHAGGLQVLGDFLAVPLEHTNRSYTARIVFYDMRDPLRPHKTLEVPLDQPRASDVAVAKLSDGRYLMIVGVDDRLRIYVSQDETFLSGAHFEWKTTWKKSRDGLGTTIGDADYGDYQNINLVTQTDGRLYLLGFNNNVAGGKGQDWLDVFRLDIDDTSYEVTVTKVAKRHMFCNWSDGESGEISHQCNFAAAAGAYIDPGRRLIVYATEHWNDGPQGDHPEGSVKMVEYRSYLEPTSCKTIRDSWVELYVNSEWTGRSLMIDFDDREAEDYSNFNTISLAKSADFSIWPPLLDLDADVSFNDEASAVRWCMPTGSRYLLFEDAGYTGGVVYLEGTGQTRELGFSGTWMQDTISSGKFECERDGRWVGATEACPDYYPPPRNPGQVWSSTHEAGVPSSKPRVTFKWLAPLSSDRAEIAGYSVSVDAPPDTTLDISADTDPQTYTTADLSPGVHRLYVRTVDVHSRWAKNYVVSKPVEIVPPCNLEVISPTAGQVVRWEESLMIEWQCGRTVAAEEKVSIALYKGGNYISNLTQSALTPAGGHGQFNWIVPRISAGDDYRILIASTTLPSDMAASAGNLTIKSRSFVSPNGGETLYRGASYEVRWDPRPQLDMPEFANIKSIVLLKGTDAVPVAGISGSVSNTGVYRWDVPGDIETGSDYKIRIFYGSSQKIIDGRVSIVLYDETSEGFFTIAEQLSVAGDLTGDGLVDGNDHQVFRRALGSCAGDAMFNSAADYDSDGCVSYADYRIWYGYYVSR